MCGSTRNRAAKRPDRVQPGEGKRKYRKDELEQQQKKKHQRDNVDWSKYSQRGERDESEEVSRELHMIKDTKRSIWKKTMSMSFYLVVLLTNCLLCVTSRT